MCFGFTCDVFIINKMLLLSLLYVNLSFALISHECFQFFWRNDSVDEKYGTSRKKIFVPLNIFDVEVIFLFIFENVGNRILFFPMKLETI